MMKVALGERFDHIQSQSLIYCKTVLLKCGRILATVDTWAMWLRMKNNNRGSSATDC